MILFIYSTSQCVFYITIKIKRFQAHPIPVKPTNAKLRKLNMRPTPIIQSIQVVFTYIPSIK